MKRLELKRIRQVAYDNAISLDNATSHIDEQNRQEVYDTVKSLLEQVEVMLQISNEPYHDFVEYRAYFDKYLG